MQFREAPRPPRMKDAQERNFWWARRSSTSELPVIVVLREQRLIDGKLQPLRTLVAAAAGRGARMAKQVCHTRGRVDPEYRHGYGAARPANPRDCS